MLRVKYRRNSTDLDYHSGDTCETGYVLKTPIGRHARYPLRLVYAYLLYLPPLCPENCWVTL